MQTFDDVARLAAQLPEVSSGERRGNRAWSVGDKAFAWERPFTKADLKRFGDVPAPTGEILAVKVADLHEKESVLAAGRPGVFTIAHFNGYAAVLLQLEAVDAAALREAIVDGWLACAPPALAEQYLNRSQGRMSG